MVDDFSAF